MSNIAYKCMLLSVFTLHYLRFCLLCTE